MSLVALALEVVRGTISVSFGRRVAEIALGVFTVLAFWNHEAWILNRNIDRGLSTGKFDSAYALTLSRDALPTLVSRLPDIPAAERTVVEDRLACRKIPVPEHWFEWNPAEAAAADAIGRLVQHRPCAPKLPTQAPASSSL
jgi:hypothetical protein